MAALARKRTREGVLVDKAYKFIAVIMIHSDDTVSAKETRLERSDFITLRSNLVRYLISQSGYAHDKDLMDLCEYVCKMGNAACNVTKNFGMYTLQMMSEEATTS